VEARGEAEDEEEDEDEEEFVVWAWRLRGLVASRIAATPMRFSCISFDYPGLVATVRTVAVLVEEET